MVTKYNPKNPNIKKFIHSNWNIIEHCDDLKKIFTQKPLIGFRRLPNLRDMLTNNKLSYPTKPMIEPIDKPKICTRLGRCTYCPRLRKTSSFTSHYTGNTHKCVNLPRITWLTCEISNIIYLIECTKCGKQYIGETGSPFRSRMYEHIASVKKSKNNSETPVLKHFNSEDHSHTNMRFSVIHWLGTKNNPNTQNWHTAKEMGYIWEVPTIHPIGINQFV